MDSKIFDLNAAFIVSTESRKFLVVIENCNIESDILFQLCQRIVTLEDEGCVVTGVVRILSDGTRPRVAFRGTKEYKSAKRNAHKSSDALTGR